jgi:monovalent cation:H+ antiporter-2, CPA2 family
MAQIGEFSFIIIAAGLATKAIGEFLYPIAIAVCVITTFTTPTFMRKSDSVTRFLDRILPDRLMTLTTLYTSWVEDLRRQKEPKEKSFVRKTLVVLALDAFIVITIVIASAIFRSDLVSMFMHMFHVGEEAGRRILVAGVFMISLPFLVWIVRSARVLGATLAAKALPRRAALDLADAPRNTLTLILELLVVVVVGMILLASAQPFLPAFSGLTFLGILIFIFSFMVWRGAADLQAHYKAGVQVIADALSRASYSGESIHEMEQILPGLGDIASLTVAESSPVVGKTLADLDIHGQTGALVVAIRRNSNEVVVPGGKEQLRSGDVVALVGTEESIESVKRIFSGN